MMSLRFIIFISVFILLLTAMDIFVISHWRKHIKSKNMSRLWYIIPYYFSGFMLIIFIVSNYLNFMVFPLPDYARWMNILTSFWYLPKILIAPVLVFISIFKYIRRKLIVSKENENTEYITDFSRRKWVGNLAWSFAGLPFILALTGLFHTVNDIKVFQENIQYERLPADLDGLRIVQLSDLHFGTYVSDETIAKMQRTINALRPDIIFITGDFVNFRYQELDSGTDFLRNLKARYGTYACLGNHDHYMTDEDHQKLVKRIKATGINLLINEHRTLKIRNSELNVVGVDNYGARQTFGDFDKAYSGISDKIFTILMSHDPKTWESHVLGKHYTDLTLSGHTHGGQVAFEFFGLELSLVKAIYKHYKGLYHEGNQYLYVNRGIGVSGPPIRLGINPEITLITLNKPTNLVIN